MLICWKKIQFKSKTLMRIKGNLLLFAEEKKETLKLFNHKLKNLFMELFVCQIELYLVIKFRYMKVYTYGIHKYRKHEKIQFASSNIPPLKKKAFNSKSMFFCSFYHHQCSLFSRKTIQIYTHLAAV